MEVSSLLYGSAVIRGAVQPAAGFDPAGNWLQARPTWLRCQPLAIIFGDGREIIVRFE